MILVSDLTQDLETIIKRIDNIIYRFYSGKEASVRFFICKGCGKIIGMIRPSKCPTKCCGEAMEEMVPNTTDAALEKHVPVIEVNGRDVTVTVGSTEHPMLEEHFIMWIALETKQGAQRKELSPGQAPRVSFALAEGDEVVAAYEYCNLHGLWKKDI